MATQTRGSPQANSSRIRYILDVTTNTPGFPARIAAISALSLNEVFTGDSEVGTAVRVQIEPMRERVGVPGDVGRVHHCGSGNVASTSVVP